MYKNILVPVVFEHDPAVDQSLDVAKHLVEDGGTVTMLHILEELPAYVEAQLPSDVRGRMHLTKEAKEQLDAIVKKGGKGFKGEVIVGHPARNILAYAEAHDCDCIIIASHKPDLSDYLIGSTAARVVRHAKCAVHVMR